MIYSSCGTFSRKLACLYTHGRLGTAEAVARGAPNESGDTFDPLRLSIAHAAAPVIRLACLRPSDHRGPIPVMRRAVVRLHVHRRQIVVMRRAVLRLHVHQRPVMLRHQRPIPVMRRAMLRHQRPIPVMRRAMLRHQ
eukprot:7656815-Pyramimonas_sp.AAC.1